jgi:hypothetical protein
MYHGSPVAETIYCDKCGHTNDYGEQDGRMCNYLTSAGNACGGFFRRKKTLSEIIGYHLSCIVEIFDWTKLFK